MENIELQTNGCVYFFRHVGLTPIKIGYSTNESPIERFKQFSTYAPYGSEILGFIQTPEAKKLETSLHLKYSSKRLLGEWFDITEEDVNKEINFYSNIEDVRNRNDFQISFAKYIQTKKRLENIAVYNSNEENKKEVFYRMIGNKTKIKFTAMAKIIGVSRKTLYLWKKEMENIGK